MCACHSSLHHVYDCDHRALSLCATTSDPGNSPTMSAYRRPPTTTNGSRRVMKHTMLFYDGDDNRRGWCMRPTWRLLYESPTCYPAPHSLTTTGARLSAWLLPVACMFHPSYTGGTTNGNAFAIGISYRTYQTWALWHHGYLLNP